MSERSKCWHLKSQVREKQWLCKQKYLTNVFILNIALQRSSNHIQHNTTAENRTDSMFKQEQPFITSCRNIHFNQLNILPKPTYTPYVVLKWCYVLVVVFICLHLTCIKLSEQATHRCYLRRCCCFNRTIIFQTVSRTVKFPTYFWGKIQFISTDKLWRNLSSMTTVESNREYKILMGMGVHRNQRRLSFTVFSVDSFSLTLCWC